MAQRKDWLIPYTIDRAYGWQAENEFLGTWSNYAYAQNIDIYTNPKALMLSKSFSEVTFGTAPTAKINKILRLPNDIQSNAYFSNDGKIYIDSGSWPALVHTLAATDKVILNAITFTDYVLVFTKTKIHRITFTGNDFKTFASITEDLLTFAPDYTWFSTNEQYDMPVYNFKDTLLYRWAGNKLFSAGNTLSAASTSETFRRWSKIVWLTFQNSFMKIYVNYMNVSSSLYYWRETNSESTDYNNKVFKAASSDGTNDYVVCSDGIYIFNGYNFVKLHDINFFDFWKSWSTYNVPQNLIGIDPYFLYVAYNKNIYKFGKKYNDLNYAFSLSNVETNNITALSQDATVTGNMFYADDVFKAYGLWSWYKTEWYLEGIVFYGESMEKEKLIDRIFNSFDIPANCSIEVFLSIDWGSYPAQPNYTIPTWTTKNWKELFANELGNISYRWIKPKIVLKSNWSWTPKLYEFTKLSKYVNNNST